MTEDTAPTQNNLITTTGTLVSPRLPTELRITVQQKVPFVRKPSYV
jgi:hypothetical protein